MSGRGTGGPLRRKKGGAVVAAGEEVVVLATLRPRAGKAAQLRETLDTVQAASRQEPDCEVYDLYESVDAEGTYHLFERYRNRDALEAHRNSDHYRAYRAQVPDLLASPVEVAVLQPVNTLAQ
jgi:quinol monooxygenase YgiN